MTSRSSKRYEGIPIAPGVVQGKARVIDVGHFPRQVPSYAVRPEDIEGELDRFRQARAAAKEDLQALIERVTQELGKSEASLLQPQVYLVDDPMLVAKVEEALVEKHRNVESAVADVAAQFEGLMASVEDAYLRERSADIRDVARRLLGKLLFVDGEMSPRLDEPAVVVSTHLVPSLTVHLDRKNILAFATEKGGATSHAAILARSIGIPAVSGLTDITTHLVDGEPIIVDGLAGVAITRPMPSIVRRYANKSRRFQSDRHVVMEHCHEPAVTLDGTAIEVMANVGRPEDLDLAKQHGADGVGLYRTEFEFLSHASPPDQDRLADIYTKAAKKFGHRELVIRVLDIGGDKFPPSFPMPHEENPFLGWRGLRLLLDHEQEILLPQLRAILRASAHGRVSILYPMVAGVEDLMAVQHVLSKAKAYLSRKHIAYDHSVRQGVMIEVPSAVMVLEALLERCDFASVGTNDLVQYVLAADRNNERLADDYNPLHPAVVHCLDRVVRGGQKAGKPTGVCGEIAADPLYTPLLLGLGYTHLSANVGAIPYVKQTIRDCDMARCRALAERVLASTTAGEVLEAVERDQRTRHRKRVASA